MEQSTPHEQDAQEPPSIPAHRGVSLVVDPDGSLRSVVRSSDHDAPLPLAPGAPISTLAAALSGTRADLPQWSAQLEAAREDPTLCRAFEIDIEPNDASPRPRRRHVTALPVAAADGSLDSVLLRIDIAHEVDGLPDPGEERFRFLAETLPQLLWMARPDGTMEYLSPQWERFTGVALDELKANGYHSVIHPDDLRTLATSAVEGDDGEYTMAPFRLRHASGGYRWVEATIKAVRRTDGALLRTVGATIDVSRRREAEAARSALTEQLKSAMAVSGMGRFVLDLRAGEATGDDRTCEILGIEPGGEGATMPAADVFAMVHPEDLEHVETSTNAALADRTGLHVECRILRQTDDGPEVRWVAVLGRVEREDDQSLRIFGVLGDVTERRAEDAARLRSQKREAIGTLAGGIAHDFNNVISAIWSNASVAQTELRAGISPETSITEIRRGAERASDVVKRLLSFSREEEPVRVPFDLAAVAREACELVRPTLAPGVQLEAPGPGQPPAVLGSSSQLHQVVVNLVGNAGDAAADGGGHITVSVDTVELGTPSNGVAGSDPVGALPAGRYVRLRVRDDGPGIPAAVMPRIFDPFFTTKAAGDGTGLGLAAAQAIVRGHGGDISADNVAAGPGAELTVILPASDAAIPAPESDKSSAAAAPPTAVEPRVLFVDDDPALARLAERGLPLHGCAVTTFTDSTEALEALRADPSAFDAVVVDLSMPGITGLDLIEAARELRPDLALVLSSGYLTPANRDRAERLGVGAILPKPCSLDSVVTAIRQLTVVGQPGSQPAE